MDKSYSKESDALRKLMANHLAYFEKNVEWADYSNWLIRLTQILEENQTPHILDKQLIAKRLAQCLYSSLPAKVHGEALTAYDQLFKNIKLLGVGTNNHHRYVRCMSSELSLYASGLFPFFQFAPLQTKIQFLKLIQDHLLELKMQLIPCLPALVACVMPGIEVANEEIQKMTTKILDSLQNVVGQKYFHSAIWMDILRVPHIRSACFKYLSKKTKPFKIIQAENDLLSSQSKQTEELSEQFKANDGTIIANQFEDEYEQQQLQQQMMEQSGENNIVDKIRIKSDSGYSICSQNQNNSTADTDQKGTVNVSIQHGHFKNPLEQIQIELLNAVNNVKNVTSEENLYPNKSSLVVNALLSVLQDENQLSRRAGLDYIISHFPINEDNLKDSEKQLLVEQCLHLMHLNEYNIMRRINTWLFGLPDIDNKFTLSEDAQGKDVLRFIELSIINIFTSPPTDKTIPLKSVQTFYREHENLIQKTLESIAYPMIKFMNENKLDQVLIVSIERLLQSISNHTNLVLNSLAMEEEDDEKTIEAGELIQFTLSIQQRDQQRQTNQLPIELQEIAKSIQPIIQSILAYFVKIGPQSVCAKKYRVLILNLMQKLLSEWQVRSINHQMDGLQISTINDFNEYFCEYLNLIRQTSNDYMILDVSTKLLIKLNLLLHKKDKKSSQLCHETTQETIELKRDVTLGNIPNSQQLQEPQSIPKWLETLLLCLSAGVPTKIQFFSVMNIYELIQSQTYFRSFLVLNNDTLITILHCLYYLLDSEKLSAQEIILRCLHFRDAFPEIFQTFIRQDLELSPSREQAIRRYSKFFGLTNFQPKERSQENSGIGVNEMIVYLTDENPLIRYASRNWLSENANYLFRIIDPLLFTLVDEYEYGQFQIGKNKRVVFKRTFNVDKVQTVYKQLKPLASILRDKFIGYCFQQSLSQSFKIKLQNIKSLHSHFDLETTSYAEILIFLSLKLLQGELETQNHFQIHLENSNFPKSHQSQGNSGSSLNMLTSTNSNSSTTEFISKSGSINANFCDFLESIITEISSDQELSQATSCIMENCLTCLSNFIDRRNQVMQVQVLNLFNRLMNKVSDRASTLPIDQLLFLIEILTSQVCFPVLLLGLTSASALYARQTYLNTINTTVLYCSLISQLIPHTANGKIPQQSSSKSHNKMSNSSNIVPDKKTKSLKLLAEYVENIINTYVSLLKQIQHRQEEEDEAQCSPIKTTRAKTGFKTMQLAKSRVMDFSFLLEIEQTATLPSSMLDQTILLEALNKLINIFLAFKKPEQDTAFQIEESNVISFFSSSPQSLPKYPLLAEFKRFENINRSILDNFSNILEVFLDCWPLSQIFSKHIILSPNGVPRYDYQSFEIFMKEYSSEIRKDSQEKNPKESLRQYIISVVKPLVELFKVDIIHALFKIYVNNINNEWPEEYENCQDNNLYDQPSSRNNTNNKSTILSKLFDLIISLDLRLDDIITIMLRSQLVLNVTNFYGKRISIPKNVFPFNRTIAIHEINVLSFAYTLFSVYPIDDTKVQISYLLDIWKPANRFFQQFKDSKHSQSLLWLIECILMMTQKFSPSEAMIEKKFRKELRRLCKGILQNLSQIAANKMKFSSVALSESAEAKRLSQTTDFSLIGPLSPTIYQIYLEDPNFLDSINSNFQTPTDNCQGMLFEQFCLSNSILCYKVLSSVSYELLQNIYSDSSRITKIIQNFLIDLFKVIEHKNQHTNPLHSLNATQVIHSLLGFSGQVLVKELRKNILEVFNGQEFLKWDIQNLRYWKDIIDKVSDQGDLFKEFLTKDGLFQNLVSKNHEQSHKIKKLFRVCFIIYAGNVDKYAKKLLDILEALNEVILNYEDNSAPGLFILTLFCFRILIMRMSKSTLSDQFRIVWPTILGFLMSIFNRKKTINQTNLVLAAIKFIELLSIVQLEEFYFYEWMFAFDCVNLELVKTSKQEAKNDIQRSGLQKRINQSGTVVTPFIFEPVLSRFFGEIYQLDYLNKLTNENKQTTLEKEERRIIISESTVENDQQLQSKVIDLAQYLIDINQKRVAVDMNQLEQTIEKDFIELNIFIDNFK